MTVTKRTIMLLCFAPALAACAQEVFIENLPAAVTSVGPIRAAADGAVVVSFSLLDDEGDDQRVGVLICDAPGEGCGVAHAGPGTPSLERVPTAPPGQETLHEFRWAPQCGRWDGTDNIASDLDTPYVFGIELLETQAAPVYSPEFRLDELGLAEFPETDCR